MTSSPTIGRAPEDAMISPEGEQTQLNELWQECQALKAELEEREPDRRTLRRMEVRVNRLCRAAAQHVAMYAHFRGGSTKEGEAARSTLAISRHDLAWLKSHRRAVPDRQVTERLGHALRASSSAVALLRWSCC